MARLTFGVPFKVVATTSTLSTIAGIKTPANQAVDLLGVNVGCDGTNSAQGPAVIDLATCTFAANSPGTNSTSVTPVALDSGRPETIQSTAGKTWTTQPTVISIIEVFYVPVYMGSAIVFRPLTVPITGKGGSGIVMSATQQSGVTANCSGSLTAIE
jgi:hypothetical protein